jgi:hypothetical protein
MKSSEPNRRRNQIIAQRSADKAALAFNITAHTPHELMQIAEEALVDAMRSAIYSGQTDRAVKMARAREAARGARLIGVQQSLF